LRRERDGRTHRLSIEAGPLHTAAEFIEQYRVFWEDTLDELARYLESDEENES
jgi:hypothetical protein